MFFHPYSPYRQVVIKKTDSSIDSEARRTLQKMSAQEYAQFVIDDDIFDSPAAYRAYDIESGNDSDKLDLLVATGCATELDWYNNERPFYNVYPVALDIVKKVKLDVPLSAIQFPYSTMCFRFPAGHEPHGVTTALVKITGFDATPSARRISHAMQVTGNQVWRNFISWTVVQSLTHDPRASILAEPTSELLERIGYHAPNNITVEDCLALRPAVRAQLRDDMPPEYHERQQQYDELLTFLYRLALFVSMLSKGDDLITPVVLAKHQERYDNETNDAAKRWLEDKAAQIQGRGFTLGKQLQDRTDTSPHWREPHRALFWTGPGRTIPVIKKRAGCLVVPKTLAEVPTGFLGPETAAELAVPEDGTVERVYFLKAPAHGFVKIGRTQRDIANRQKASKTFYPGGLVLLGYITTGDCVALEARLHREYADCREDNEFFSLTDDDVRRILKTHGGQATEHLGQAI